MTEQTPLFAVSKKHAFPYDWRLSDGYPAIVINVFLGWTFIGWVVAFAMAVSKDK